MKRYEKTINGKLVRKQLNEITIKKDGMVTYNPTEEMALADGWVEYVVPVYEPTVEELLREAKKKKREEIMEYDSSESVNSFTINGFETWIDKATRVGLKLRFEAELAAGLTETTLWQNGVSFPLPLLDEGNALDMLNAIELYASKCYDNTQEHCAVMELLTTVADVEAYDYTTGYPEKLVF